MYKKRIVIIGGGSAGLYLASMLDGSRFDITILEGQKTVGRKFLVAGKGGFNLSHSLPVEEMVNKYFPSNFIETFIMSYPSSSLVKYMRDIGIDTYIGSSGKIFPVEGIKPIQVLNAILEKIHENGVNILTGTRWKRTEGRNIFIIQNGVQNTLEYDCMVYALGGSSWKVTGSDGAWLKSIRNMGITTVPFKGSNCGVLISWSEEFKKYWEGVPIKNIQLSCGNHSVKGEVIITSYGMEGAPVYELNRFLRSQGEFMKMVIDLIPAVSSKKLLRFQKALKSSRSMGSILKSALGLDAIKLALLREFLDKESYQDRINIEGKLRAVQIPVDGFRPIDEAISTTGGIALSEVNGSLMLKKMPDQYAIGEMLDWDAPTGGYLLQACYSMAAYLADHLNKKERHEYPHRSA